VATFLIETYLPRGRSAEMESATSNLRSVARDAPPDAPLDAPPVRYLRSFYVPDDEMAFHVVEAPSLEATVELTRRAGLSPERIVETEASSG
jgi:hypothetical protein